MQQTPTGKDKRKSLFHATSPYSPYSSSEFQSGEGTGNPRGRLAFVESQGFLYGTALIISANIVEIAVSTDIPDWQGWSILDNVFMFFFIVELAIRLAHHGTAFFVRDESEAAVARQESGHLDDRSIPMGQNLWRRLRWWGILDAVIVGAGISDLWLSSSIEAKPQDSERNSPQNGSTSLWPRATAFAPLLRFLRFFRLVRLLRLLKLNARAMQFIVALVNMRRHIINTFVVLFMFLGCSSILLTHLLGHGEAVPDAIKTDEMDAMREKVRETFKSVPDSFFALFQVTTVDNWDHIANPIITLNPSWRIFFVFFVFFASWVVLSVLTAVASDSLVAAASDQKKQERRIANERKEEFIRFMREAFKDADADGNGNLDKAEFETMISKDFVLKRMRLLGVDMTEDDMRNTWEMMDLDESGEISIDEFVTGLSFLQDTLSTKHVVNANYELKKMACRLDQKVNSLLTELDQVKSQNEAMLKCLQTQEEHYEQQQLSLWLWHEWASKHDPSAIPEGMTLPIRLPINLEDVEE